MGRATLPGFDHVVVTRIAPSGGVTVDVPFILGSEFLIPMASAAAGMSVTCVLAGLVALPFKSGDTWATSGLPVYWSVANGCEDTDSATNYLIGTYDRAWSATHIVVSLNGTSLATADGDIVAKVNKLDLASQVHGKGASLIGIELPSPVPEQLANVHTTQDFFDLIFGMIGQNNGGGESADDAKWSAPDATFFDPTTAFPVPGGGGRGLYVALETATHGDVTWTQDYIYLTTDNGVTWTEGQPYSGCMLRRNGYDLVIYITGVWTPFVPAAFATAAQGALADAAQPAAITPIEHGSVTATVEAQLADLVARVYALENPVG